MKFIENKRTVFFLLILSFLVRLSVGIYGYINEEWKNFGDDNARNKYANSIIENGITPELDSFYTVESIFAPFIPLVLALKTSLFGSSWFPVFILNSFVGALTCLIIYLISLQFFDRKLSLFVFLWAAFYPSFVRYISTSGNEVWIVFLFTLSFFYSIKAINIKQVTYHLILYSLFFTLLMHTDERYITYSILFTLFLLIGNYEFKFKLKKITLFILLTLLFSTPWLIRNYIVYDSIVLISCRTNNLTDPIFNHSDELLFFDHTPNYGYLSEAEIDSVQQRLLTTFRTGKPIYKGQIEAMKKGNVPYFFSPSQKFFSRIYFLWVPFKFKDNYRITGYSFNPAWSFMHNIISIFSFAILLPFSVLGIYLLYRQRKYSVLILFLSTIIFHTLIHALFIPYTRDRYRHPIDFIIVILGCYGIVFLLSTIYKNLYLNKKNG